MIRRHRQGLNLPVDCEIYSLQRYLGLLAEGQAVALERSRSICCSRRIPR